MTCTSEDEFSLSCDGTSDLASKGSWLKSNVFDIFSIQIGGTVFDGSGK